jgi:hypothetical protein
MQYPVLIGNIRIMNDLPYSRYVQQYKYIFHNILGNNFYNFYIRDKVFTILGRYLFANDINQYIIFINHDSKVLYLNSDFKRQFRYLYKVASNYYHYYTTEYVTSEFFENRKVKVNVKFKSARQKREYLNTFKEWLGINLMNCQDIG